MQLDSSDIALVVYVEYAEENGNNTKRIDGYMLMNSNTNLLIYITERYFVAGLLL